MSVWLELTLKASFTCDECGNTIDIEDEIQNYPNLNTMIEAFEDSIGNNNWIIKDDEHYCPDCAKQLEAHEKQFKKMLDMLPDKKEVDSND